MNRINESLRFKADNDCLREMLPGRSRNSLQSSPTAHLELEELVKKYHQTGAQALFSELYRRTRHLVLGCALKILKDEQRALDVSSEVYAKIMLKLQDTLPLNFKSWLFAVSRNQSLEYIRREQRIPRAEALDEHLEVQGEEQLSQELLLEHAREIRRVIGTLPEGQAQCIQLFFFSGLRYKEISEETGMSPNEVKSHIQNGKRKLRQLLRPTWEQWTLQA